jgi:hypothetical protein
LQQIILTESKKIDLNNIQEEKSGSHSLDSEHQHEEDFQKHNESILNNPYFQPSPQNATSSNPKTFTLGQIHSNQNSTTELNKNKN